MFKANRTRLLRKVRNSIVFSPQGGARVRLCGLTRRDAALYAAHLRRLSPDDRQARFHHRMKDASVEAYARSLDWERALVFGAFVGGVLRGVGELQPTAGGRAGEIALSVERDFQHAAIGRLLMAALLTAGRLSRLEEVTMVFLQGNDRMRALARGSGARLVSNAGTTEGALNLPPRH